MITLIHGLHGSTHTAHTIRTYLDQRGVDAPHQAVVLLSPASAIDRLGEATNSMRQAIAEALQRGDALVIMQPDGFDDALFAHYYPPDIRAMRDHPTLTYTPDTFGACLVTLCTDHLPTSNPLAPPPVDDRLRAEYALAQGAIHYHREAYPAATAALDEAIGLHPTFSEAYTYRALAHYYRDNYETALADCETALTLAPSTAEAIAIRGLVYNQQGNPQAALVEFDRAIALDPTNAAHYNNRAITLKLLGNTTEALAGYTTALERNPYLAVVYLNRANLHLDDDHAEDALADVERAAALNAGYWYVPYTRSLCYRALGRTAEVLAEMTQAVQLAPHPAMALAWQARLAFESADYPIARDILTRLLEDDPTNAQQWIEHAELNRLLGDVDAALADAERGLDLDPSYAVGYVAYGRCLMHTGLAYAAIDEYNTALELDPTLTVAIHERANANIALKRWRLALQDLDRAIAAGETGAAVHINRSVALRRMRRTAQALAAAQHALKLEPDNLTAHFQHGIVLAYRGQFVAAINEFSYILEREPTYVATRRNLRVVQQARRNPLWWLLWQIWPSSGPK